MATTGVLLALDTGFGQFSRSYLLGVLVPSQLRAWPKRASWGLGIYLGHLMACVPGSAGNCYCKTESIDNMGIQRGNAHISFSGDICGGCMVLKNFINIVFYRRSKHNKSFKFVSGLWPSTGPKKAAPFWAA